MINFDCEVLTKNQFANKSQKREIAVVTVVVVAFSVGIALGSLFSPFGGSVEQGPDGLFVEGLRVAGGFV